MTKTKQRGGESKRLIEDAGRIHDWKRWGRIFLNGSGEPSGKTIQPTGSAGTISHTTMRAVAPTDGEKMALTALVTRCLEDFARSRRETGMKQGARAK